MKSFVHAFTLPLGSMTLLLASGCASGPSHDCAFPPTPPPCGCMHAPHGLDSHGVTGSDHADPHHSPVVACPHWGRDPGAFPARPRPAEEPAAPVAAAWACQGRQPGQACVMRHFGWELLGVCQPPSGPMPPPRPGAPESSDVGQPPTLVCSPNPAPDNFFAPGPAVPPPASAPKPGAGGPPKSVPSAAKPADGGPTKSLPAAGPSAK